jgi:hypothetical protein
MNSASSPSAIHPRSTNGTNRTDRDVRVSLLMPLALNRRKKNSGHMMPSAWKPANAVLWDARKLRSILQQLLDIIEVATVCKCNGATHRTVQDVKRF